MIGVTGNMHGTDVMDLVQWNDMSSWVSLLQERGGFDRMSEIVDELTEMPGIEDDVLENSRYLQLMMTVNVPGCIKDMIDLYLKGLAGQLRLSRNATELSEYIANTMKYFSHVHFGVTNGTESMMPQWLPVVLQFPKKAKYSASVLSFSKDGMSLVVNSGESNLVRLPVRNMVAYGNILAAAEQRIAEELDMENLEGSLLRHAEFSNDSRSIVAALTNKSQDDTDRIVGVSLVIWSNSATDATENRRVIEISKSEQDDVDTAAFQYATFSGDDKFIATTDSKSVAIVNVDERIIGRRLTGHTRNVLHVSFGDSDKKLVSASEDGTAKIWRLDNGELGMTLEHGDGSVVTCAYFNSDSTIIMTAEKQGFVHLWDLNDGQTRRTLGGVGYKAGNCAKYSKDYTLIVTGGADGKIRLWENSDTLSPLDIFDTTLAEPSEVVAVDIYPFNTRVLAGLSNGTVQTWCIDAKTCYDDESGCKTNSVTGGRYDVSVGLQKERGRNVFYLSFQSYVDATKPMQKRESPSILMTENEEIVFVQEDASNTGHPLRIYFDPEKKNEMVDQDAVSSVGTPGEEGAYTKFKPSKGMCGTFYYQCSQHAGMGSSIVVQDKYFKRGNVVSK